jgi:transposase
MEERILRMIPLLNERLLRQYLANEAISYGRGGITLVSRISGVSRTTITTGINELKSGEEPSNKIRKSGGGRKATKEKYPDIAAKIREIIDGKTYGDPMRVLSYTTESLRKISKELLERYDILVSYVTVGSILDSMGYSKQANQKMLQNGEPHPDRNAQFEYINSVAAAYLEIGVPVISVDTKKKKASEILKTQVKNIDHQRTPARFLTTISPSRNLGK